MLKKGRVVPGKVLQHETGDIEAKHCVIGKEAAPACPVPFQHDDPFLFQEQTENHMEPVASLGLGHVGKEGPLAYGDAHIFQVFRHIH